MLFSFIYYLYEVRIVFGDGIEKQIKQHAIMGISDAYFYLHSDTRKIALIKPPLYLIGQTDLRIPSEVKPLLELLKQKKEEEFTTKLKSLGFKDEEIKNILKKIYHRDKIWEIMKEKGILLSQEELDAWKVEYWTGRDERGRWHFFRYRVPKTLSLLSRLSRIKRKFIDPGIIIKIQLVLNIILIVWLVILAAGYYYPEIQYLLMQLITARDMFYLIIISILAYVIATLKLNEWVFYANFLYLPAEVVKIPLQLGEDGPTISADVKTIYLYQSDEVPPAETDVFQWDREEIKEVVRESLFREWLDSLAKLDKAQQEIQKLSLENNMLRSSLNEAGLLVMEAELIGMAKALKLREKTVKAIREPVRFSEFLKYIAIIATVGTVAYIISEIMKSPIGAFVIGLTITLIAILISVLLTKLITTRVEYRVVREGL